MVVEILTVHMYFVTYMAYRALHCHLCICWTTLLSNCARGGMDDNLERR